MMKYSTVAANVFSVPGTGTLRALAFTAVAQQAFPSKASQFVIPYSGGCLAAAISSPNDNY